LGGCLAQGDAAVAANIEMVGEIILLAIGASVFPSLLACVAIIVSRPEPRGLLLAFFAGGLIASLTSGIGLLVLFNNGHAVLGSTKHSPHPANSIVAGTVALLFAWLMASSRGQALIDRWRSRRKRRRGPEKARAKEATSWAERGLGRASAKIAFLIGAAIDLPGPFYILAIGKIARGHYGPVEQFLLILLFNVIMFLLLEIPLVGYLVSPETTTQRVQAMSRWLNANGLRVTGGLVGLFGASLLVQGVAAL
jgi:hypothetical protein